MFEVSPEKTGNLCFVPYSVTLTVCNEIPTLPTHTWSKTQITPTASAFQYYNLFPHIPWKGYPTNPFSSFELVV